ncbi:MAG: hypothetical protein V7K43_26205 [Nostoc sp.]
MSSTDINLIADINVGCRRHRTGEGKKILIIGRQFSEIDNLSLVVITRTLIYK